MKCIKLEDGKIVRVPDEEAAELVADEKGKYTTKNAWRRQARKP